MTRLGEALRCYRVMKNRNMRGLGREVGISAAAWMRLEHGRACDATTLVKLLQWLLAPRAPEGTKS